MNTSQTFDMPSLPEAIISQEALEYLGYTSAKASDIWNAWLDWPDWGNLRETDPDNGYDPVYFIDYARGNLGIYAKQKEDAWGPDDNAWTDCMNTMGLAPGFQRAIMDPAFRAIRLRQTCTFWVKDTFLRRYSALEQAHGVWTAPCLTPFAQDKTRLEQPGFTTLYRAVPADRHLGRFIDEEGRLDHIDIARGSPEYIFSPNTCFTYFCLDVRFAESHASYMKRRAPAKQVAIVSIQIPDSALAALEGPDKYSLASTDPEWQMLVFCAHRREGLRGHMESTMRLGCSLPPRHRSRILRSAPSTTGHRSTRPSFSRLVG